MIEARKFVLIDGIKTCYYEAGGGPTVVLLHSGEFGACADLTWEFNFHALAKDFHVVAPDWLGYGKTDKIFDFVSGAQRRLDHMQQFLKTICADKAHIVGSSMGGVLALRAFTLAPDFFPVRSLTLIGAGGNSPASDARRALLEYDCTLESMRKVMAALFEDEKWLNDADYVRRRHQLSLEPGAWECAAAARLKNPTVPDRPDVALVDTTPYEKFQMPVLVLAGGADKIKEPGYGEKLVKQLPKGELHVIPNAGHMPNIEQADAVNKILKGFFNRVGAA